MKDELVGTQLRRLRERSGVSGRTLAHRSSVSQSKISKIESGVVAPSKDDVLRLAKGLRLSTDVTAWLLSLPVTRAANDPFATYAEMEIAARTVQAFMTYGIPPLLHTPEYLRYVLTGHFTEAEISSAIWHRLHRQAERYVSHKSFQILLTEGGLLRFSEEPMWHRQIVALQSDAMVLPDQVRILPDSLAAKLYLIEDFTLLNGNRAQHDNPAFDSVRHDPDTTKVLATRFADAWELAQPLRESAFFESLLRDDVDVRDLVEY